MMLTEKIFYTVYCGCQVRSIRFQLIPSSNIESCAADKHTLPEVACGHTNLPRSNFFENRHSPSPDHQSSFTRSPRLPLKTKT
jgi:hypothetical protein